MSGFPTEDEVLAIPRDKATINNRFSSLRYMKSVNKLPPSHGFSWVE
jgi:hypothetical protein